MKVLIRAGFVIDMPSSIDPFSYSMDIYKLAEEVNQNVRETFNLEAQFTDFDEDAIQILPATVEFI